MNHKNLSFGAVCRHMTVSLGIIDFTAFLRMINNLVIIIITILNFDMFSFLQPLLP